MPRNFSNAKAKRVGLCLALISSLSLLGACSTWDAWTEAPANYREGTIGQELIDLAKARDEGIITEAEYELAKRDILWRYEE